MNKPNNLPLNASALEMAASLSTNPEFESDDTLLATIQLQRIFEDTRDVHRLEKSSGAASRLHLHTDRLLLDLESWKRSLPPNHAQFSKAHHEFPLQAFD